uniref:ATP synthase F0 subunit 8 n=1 Tax=Plaxiphora albida TaxID=256106 RepID=A0A6H1PFW6_PLAAB|nr:ATP synthase F0 subunit 8 [Plaxiphora albida]
MPQLAPLNWILLVILFWLAMLTLTLTIWWLKDKKYIIIFTKKDISFKNKKWMW